MKLPANKLTDAELKRQETLKKECLYECAECRETFKEGVVIGYQLKTVSFLNNGDDPDDIYNRPTFMKLNSGFYETLCYSCAAEETEGGMPDDDDALFEIPVVADRKRTALLNKSADVMKRLNKLKVLK